MVSNFDKHKIDKVDIVSFDLYETLVYRIFAKPKDLFEYINKYYKEGNVNFTDLRIMAEKICLQKYGAGNYTFDNIYEQFNLIINNSKLTNYFKLIEQELEFKNILPNREMIDLLNYTVSKNKIVIITSDMYFSEEFISKILLKCNIKEYKKIYISSQYKASKHDGSLFKIIKSQYKDKKILHIGDSYRGDFAMPKTNSIKSIHYHKANIKDNNLEKTILDKLFYISKNTVEDKYEILGLTKLGPLIYSFCSWIYENVKNDENPIFFLAREGAFIKYIFEKMYPHLSKRTHYLYVSRQSTQCIKLQNINNYNDLLNATPIHKQLTAKEYFKRLGIQMGSEKKYITNSDLSNISLDIINEIKSKNKELSNTLVNYLRENQFNNNVYICDIGWNGSMQDCLNLLPFVNINGLYLATTQNISSNKKGFTNYSNFRPFVHLIENFFLANHGTTLGYQEKNNVIVPILADVEFTDNIYQKIQLGAIKFVDIITQIFESKLQIVKQYALENILKLGLTPKYSEIKLFTTSNYLEYEKFNLINFNHGSLYYLFHLKQLVTDLKNSGWKMAFLRLLFKLPFPYHKIYSKLISKGVI